MDDLLRLKTGGYNPRALDIDFSPSDPFRFVPNENHRDILMESGHFQIVEGDRLSATLDGKVGDVTGLIESGECDAILDFLLYAERQHKGRSPVLNRLFERSQVIENDADEDEDGDPGVRALDLTTAR